MHQGPSQIPTPVVLAKSPMKGIWLFFPLVSTSHKGCRYKMAESEISMKVAKKRLSKRSFVVTLNQNHGILHLFNIIQILNKFKIFLNHQIKNFSNSIDLRKQDILSQEKISEHSRFVNKDISKS